MRAVVRRKDKRVVEEERRREAVKRKEYKSGREGKRRGE